MTLSDLHAPFVTDGIFDANIVVGSIGTAAGISSDISGAMAVAAAFAEKANTIISGIGLSDNEVSNPINLLKPTIIVGGGEANLLTAKLSSNGKGVLTSDLLAAKDRAYFQLIENAFSGSHTVLVIAGRDAKDTNLACQALAADITGQRSLGLTGSLVWLDTNIYSNHKLKKYYCGDDVCDLDESGVNCPQDCKLLFPEPNIINITDSLGNVNINSITTTSQDVWPINIRSNPSVLYCDNCVIKIGDILSFTIYVKKPQETLIEYSCYVNGVFLKIWNSTSNVGTCEWNVSSRDFGINQIFQLKIKDHNGLDYLTLGNGDDYTSAIYNVIE